MGKRVLVVDDEKAQREIITDILEDFWEIPCDGFLDCESAWSGVLAQPEGTYGLAFIDTSSLDPENERLPDGRYFSTALREKYPNISLIRYSGHTKGNPETAENFHGWYSKGHGNIVDIACFLEEAGFELAED